MSNEIKVTDKRMFTTSGELKEEFRHLADAEVKGAEQPAAEESPDRGDERPEEERPGGEAPGGPREPRQGAAPVGGGEPGPRSSSAPQEGPERPPLEIPGTPPGMGAPTFYDLVGLLAEPVAIYLGDVELPDGGSAENLDAARLHIDLLDVLRKKTVGNLTSQESAVLEDVLYRLRMRYVSKRG